MPDLIVVGGATAVGKSSFATELALRVGGEIVSADSMSLYRGMDIGTAKPVREREMVRHHLIDLFEPGERVDAKIYEREAVLAIRDIRSRGRIPILTGGTYLYIQAVLYGIEDTPPPSWGLRKRLYRIAQSKGSQRLYHILRAVDPPYAGKVHPRDLRRVVRALEVFVESGRPFSTYHRWDSARFDYVGFYVKRSWESLSRRIEMRVREMIEKGLLEEVKKLLEMGFESFLTSSQAIGYKELVPCIRGKKSLEECVEETIKNTRSYAKRQIRWFRKQGWIEIDLDRLSLQEAVSVALRYLREG